MEEHIGFDNLLAEERPRLVRLCAWLSGSQEAAEDLAQETLLQAWKSRARLEGADKLKPWLNAIARNVCLNWSRQQYREQARRMDLQAGPAAADAADGSTADAPEDLLPDETDLELDLDRAELARLLDQALALLPAETAQVLVEHYIQDSPHAEIAARLGLNPGTVAVRLQRGKLTLRRLLRANFPGEAAAFGLLDPASPAWEETNMWCPTCGQARLLGQYQKQEPGGRFALRCPRCSPHPEKIMTGLDLSLPFNAGLLGGLKTYKPAYTRLITSLAEVYRQAAAERSAACPACGRPAEVLIEPARKSPGLPDEAGHIRIRCHGCGWASSQSRSALALAAPETQRFWRENPRIRTLAAQEIESQGALSVLTRLQSVTTAAELAVISTRDTFQILGIYQNK